MLTKKRPTDFCIVCETEAETPPGYDARKHKFVCSDKCKVIEQLFTTVYDDTVQKAMGMYQLWVKQCGK